MSIEYLVTGGAGFIGSNIVHTLVDAGNRVRVLDNLSTGREGNLSDIAGKIELVKGDIRDVETVKKAVAGVRYVLHLAALPSVSRSVADPVSTNNVNIGGTLNILVQARDAGVERVVFSSSSSVYGDLPVLPKREDMMPTPRSPYALSKLTGEHYGRMFFHLYGLKTFSLRYFNVYGPRQNPKSQYAAVIPKFIEALSAGRPPTIHGDGGQTRDFTFVDDVVNANLCCCKAPEKAAGGVFNVGGGRRVSVNDLAKKMMEIMGRHVEPVHDAPQPGDVRDSQADYTRAAELLGWGAKVVFDEGLRRTIDWFTRHEAV